MENASISNEIHSMKKIHFYSPFQITMIYFIIKSYYIFKYYNFFRVYFSIIRIIKK